jgi:RecA-family ATPase
MDGSYDKTADFATGCGVEPVEFLQAITGGGPVNLVAIVPDGPVDGRIYRVDEKGAAILTLVERASQQRRNLHFALNEPRADRLDKRGKLKEDDFGRLRGLAVDLDPREEVEREEGGWQSERDRLLSLARDLIQSGLCPASAAIDTGNGVQLIWLFAEPIENTPENRAAVKAQAAGLADRLEGDAVQSVEHLFRLPGTRNFPNAKKKAKGRGETVARVLHLDTSRRYRLEDLAHLATPREERSRAAVDLPDFDYPAVLEAAESGPEGLPQALQNRVAELRERRGFAAAMENPDRSHRDWAIAANCIGAGMTDPTEIGCVTFALSPEKLREKDGQGAGEYYATHTLSRALAQVKPDLGPEAYFKARERKSQFFRGSDMAGRPVPPREWLVVDLVPQNTVTLLGGDGGTGKSLLALQLAAGVAMGAEWIGKPVSQGRAICISAEDDEDELQRRLADILRSTGREFEDLGALTLRSLAGEDALLAVESNLRLVETALFKELDKRAEEDRPSLIVIDTLADVYPASENDRAKVRQFVGMLRQLALKHRCAVILLAHPSLSGLNSGSGMSGSTAWNNSVRSRLYLSRIDGGGHESDPDKRTLSTKKANYGRSGDEISLRWQRGVFEVAQQVIVTEGESEADNLTKPQRVFLKLLARRNEEGRFVSHNPGPTFAPAQFEREPEAENIRKSAFTAAMNALFRDGRIVIAEHGKGAKARSHIAIVEGQKHAE